MELFQFTQEEKDKILKHILEEEEQTRREEPYLVDSNGHLTICQLFENDTLFTFVKDNTKLPQMLDEIDWNWLNRPFN